jgi:hypothetical protein
MKHFILKTKSKVTISVFLLIFTLFSPLGINAQTTNPPSNGTLGTVINTGSNPQVKTGDLSVNAFTAVLNSYFASRLGVGTPSILATLDVNPTVTATTDLKNIKSGLVYNGGSAMANYYGTYIAAPTGSGSITNKYALVTEPAAGKVGIGTLTPASQLSVNGSVQMSDDTSACTVAKAGTVRWHTSALEVCNGTAWVNARAPLTGPTCSAGNLCGFIYYKLTTSYFMPAWDNGRTGTSYVGYECIKLLSPALAPANSSCPSAYAEVWRAYPNNGSVYNTVPIPTSIPVYCDDGYTYEELKRLDLSGTGGIAKYEVILGACRKQ